jgi:hypothetical protein
MSLSFVLKTRMCSDEAVEVEGEGQGLREFIAGGGWHNCIARSLLGDRDRCVNLTAPIRPCPEARCHGSRLLEALRQPVTLVSGCGHVAA